MRGTTYQGCSNTDSASCLGSSGPDIPQTFSPDFLELIRLCSGVIPCHVGSWGKQARQLTQPFLSHMEEHYFSAGCRGSPCALSRLMVLKVGAQDQHHHHLLTQVRSTESWGPLHIRNQKLGGGAQQSLFTSPSCDSDTH